MFLRAEERFENGSYFKGYVHLPHLENTSGKMDIDVICLNWH